MFKKILLTLFVILTPALSFAMPTFDRIVIFGDSLSDNGNLYRYSLGIIPKSPPYGSDDPDTKHGVFSNSYVWSELAEKEFKSNNISMENYAIGGEPVLFHNPLKGFLPLTLNFSIDDYLFHHPLNEKYKETTLFIVWIGANDYLPGMQSDPVTDTSKVVAEIRKQILNLIDKHDAKIFLVMGLPNLGRTPEAAQNGITGDETKLAIEHNKALQHMVQEIQSTHPNIVMNYFDTYDLFNDMMDNPQKFNDRYGTHITNITDPCWTGGYTLKQDAASKALVIQDLTLQMKNKHGISTVSPDLLAHYIAQSPGLMEAYSVGKQYDGGGQRCSDEDNHVFWDHVHPTSPVHTIIADIVTDYIKQHYAMAG